MDPARYQRLYEIFTLVRSEPTDRRQAVLVDACGQDSALRAELERMLAVDTPTSHPTASTSILEPKDRPTDPATPAASAVWGEQAGDLIGPYKLIQVIGEGGFGTVWVAERRRPMVQRVALKIIKPGMDIRWVIARFDEERQMLALMDHPGIAKIYDAGVTDSGRPYFVMEYVVGDSITAYCDKRRLTLAERLNLFISVCEAVQHAHRRGIIHRDLKPSNILVTVSNDRPTPKVIDFGIAKALARPVTTEILLTEAGHIFGTPEYMSPEQAEADGADVDTRSDVYALGAVLYELLAGVQPLDSETLRGAGATGIAGMIRQAEPLRPSIRFAGLHLDVAEAIAQRRGATPAKLQADLRHELEWIPLMALRKDRARRYGSPDELADDIRNYLQGRALASGPESRTYRARKLVRRNAPAVAIVGALVGALILGVTAFGWQARTARAQRDAAIADRDRAQAVADVLTRFLHAPNSAGADTRPDITVAQAIDNALKALREGELAHQPAAKAAVLRAIAKVLDSNGRRTQALALADQALKIETDLHPHGHADVATSLDAIVNIYRSLGRPADGEAQAVRAVEMRRALGERDSPGFADSLDNLSVIRLSQRRFDEADQTCSLALDMRKRLFGNDHQETARGLTSLANVRTAQGRLEQAESFLAHALDIQRKLDKGDSPMVAAALHNLADARERMSRPSSAEPLYQESLGMLRRQNPDGHPAMATIETSLLHVYLELKRPDEAVAAGQEALRIRQELFGNESSDAVSSLIELSKCLATLDRNSEARMYAKQAVTTAERLTTLDRSDLRLQSQRLLADIEARISRTSDAAVSPSDPS